MYNLNTDNLSHTPYQHLHLQQPSYKHNTNIQATNKATTLTTPAGATPPRPLNTMISRAYAGTYISPWM